MCSALRQHGALVGSSQLGFCIFCPRHGWKPDGLGHYSLLLDMLQCALQGAVLAGAGLEGCGPSGSSLQGNMQAQFLEGSGDKIILSLASHPLQTRSDWALQLCAILWGFHVAVS